MATIKKTAASDKKPETTKVTTELLVSRHDLIADVVALYPEAAEVLMDFGVSCAGCDVSAYETLEEGILGHGFSEEEFEEVLQDLNEIAEELEKHKSKKK